MAHPQIAVFARLADGNPAPTRKIEGQKTLLGRTMHGIAYDEIHDEIVVPQQFAQGILTFRGSANGEEAPIRVIQGSKTRMIQPDRLALDAVHGEIFVAEGKEVLVFSREQSGNVAPIRVLHSTEGKMHASAPAVDPVRNLLVVGSDEGGNTQFLIFNRTDQGDVKPKAIIGGPKSGVLHLAGPFAVYPPKGWIIATMRDEGELVSDIAYVGVWSIEDNGDVPPRWRFGGPNGVLKMPRGVAIDAKNKSVFVSDKRMNAVMTFSVPELF